MVKFSSNLKRPKVVSKQTGPFVSKEAPPNYKLHQNHSLTRSLPSSPHSSSIVVQEIGLSTGQAVKKLIEEIDRILQIKRNHFNYKFNINQFLRYFSLLTMTVFSREDNVGWFYGFILFSEVIFIELIERRRRASSVPDSMKEIKKKLRLIDKSILSETIDLDNVYSQVK